ncbi:MAG: hypothetical protein RR426_09030, partial [Oscillospiraceae bacterium]
AKSSFWWNIAWQFSLLLHPCPIFSTVSQNAPAVKMKSAFAGKQLTKRDIRGINRESIGAIK